ncbi:MAG: nickel-responsive transcriptional regulator NikR [Candidatus Thermoplasmatota archaeon]
MQVITRFGVSIEPELLHHFDQLIQRKGYTNRSEAIRDLIRDFIVKQKTMDPESESLGTLTILYDHHSSSLNERLLSIQHDHHESILTTTHIHIDHHTCLEILVLKGKTADIQRLSDTIQALKGIKHGELVITQRSF